MADQTPSTLRALLTMDRRFSNGAISPSGTNGASYSQAGGMAGRPVPAQSTGLAELQASGTQADGASYQVTAVRGGNPGPVVGSLLNLGAAAFAWRDSGDTSISSYRGWDPPSTISAFEFVDRSTTASAWKDPHVISRADGSMYCIVQEASRYIAVWSRPLAGSWSKVRIYDPGSGVYTGAVHAAPCLVSLPSGRLVALFWLYDASGSGIASSMSDDDGATWSTPQLVETVLGAAGAVVTRIRAAYLSGQILMIVSTTAGGLDVLGQFASVDGGASFSVVGTLGDWAGGMGEVVTQGGAYVVISIDPALTTTGSTVVANARRFASAYTLGSSITPTYLQSDASTRRWGTVAAGALTAADLSVCSDDNGTLWAIGSDYNAAGGALREYYTVRSEDGGVSWTQTGTQSGAWWRGLDASTHPQDVSACAQGGRLVVLSNAAQNPGTADDSLCATYLGGSTTIGQPQAILAVSLTDYSCGQSVTWLPFDLPENTGATWTRTSAGAATVTMTGLGMRVQHTGLLDSESWAAAPATTNAQGLLPMAEVRVTVGTAKLSASISGGANGYTAEVTITPTAITLRDAVAGSNVASISTTAATTGVQVKFGLGTKDAAADTGKVYAYYRPTSTNADRKWILIGKTGVIAGTMLQRGAVLADAVSFSTAAGNASTDIYFRQVAYAAGADTGVNLYGGQFDGFPTGTLGQTFGAAPSPLAETGVRLAMTDGPARAGESWTVATTYRYPVSRIDPLNSPSPDARWRSTTDAVEQLIVWSMTEATPPEGQFWGLYLDGANFQTATLEGWDGAAWNVLGTLSLAIGTGLKFSRAGEVVSCDATGGNACADFIERDALRGAIWKPGGGGTPRYIRTNSGGRWTPGALVKTTRPTVILDTFAVGDVASGSGAAIVSQRGCLLVRTVASYSRYALRIPAQATPDGFFTLGAAVIGPVAWLGSYDYARQFGIVTNVDTVEAGNGSRRKRKLGKPRRYAQLSWTDGIDTSNTHDSVPDYVDSYTGGQHLGGPAQVATDITGLVLVNDISPVVYLPKVDVPATASTTVITARDLMLYATIETDTLQTDVVVGEEHTGDGRGELVRVGTVRLEEQL